MIKNSSTKGLGLNYVEPAFKAEFRVNFQGFIEDNFCLGCAKTGAKFYVGITNNKERRHQEHLNIGRYNGSKWI